MNNIQKILSVLSIFTLINCSSAIQKEDTKIILNQDKSTIDYYNKYIAMIFGSREFDNIVRDLLDNNIDIKIAKKRINESESLVNFSKASLYPDISGLASTTRGNNQFGLVKPGNVNKAGLNANLDLDIFGAKRADISAARSVNQYNVASLKQVRSYILTQVLTLLVNYNKFEQILKEQEKIADNYNQIVVLLEMRTESGLANSLELENTKAKYKQALAESSLTKQEIKKIEYKITKLLGQYPKDIKKIFADIKANNKLNLPTNPSVIKNISIVSIKKRAEVMQAEAELNKSGAELKKYEANLWPQISLGSFFGAQDLPSSVPFAPQNPIWSISSSISAPIFNFGKLHAAVKAAGFRKEQVMLAYKNAILQGFEETHVALSDYLTSINVLNKSLSENKYMENKLKLASLRYRNGLDDITLVMTNEIDLAQNKITLYNRQADVANHYILLHKALGEI